MTGESWPMTVMVIGREMVSPFFEASTTTVWAASNVGVPLIAPVVAFNESPAGSDLALKTTPVVLVARVAVKGWLSEALNEADPVNAKGMFRARRMPVRESEK